ncbi:MAG: CBS domain-containing protein [Pseudomonadota bacterium]|nr:CBS domain-containing protein [Pseudomonadota bacterium]
MVERIIPDVVTGQKLRTLEPTATAREAARVMGSKKISAVLVADKKKLIGIVTERDLAAKVLAGSMDPDKTTLLDIMTPDPDYLSPDDSPESALELMSTRGYRHLPVMNNDDLIAIVSIRDLYAFVKQKLEEDVKQRDAFMFETGYGA